MDSCSRGASHEVEWDMLIKRTQEKGKKEYCFFRGANCKSDHSKKLLVCTVYFISSKHEISLWKTGILLEFWWHFGLCSFYSFHIQAVSSQCYKGFLDNKSIAIVRLYWQLFLCNSQYSVSIEQDSLPVFNRSKMDFTLYKAFKNVLKKPLFGDEENIWYIRTNKNTNYIEMYFLIIFVSEFPL